MKIKYLFRLTLSILMLCTTAVFAQLPVRNIQIADTTKFIHTGDSALILRPLISDSVKIERVIIDELEQGMSLMSSGVTVQGSDFLPDFSQSTPSPNASALIRAVNNPVNLATGSVTMQAPLYTLDAGSIQIPLALNYQATGIQVGQKASNVGLGWRFSAGGQVTRVVKGYPDEQAGVSTRKTQGWCNGWPFTDELSVYEWCAYGHKAAKAEGFGGLFSLTYYKYAGQIDNEPDIFYFEIPGKSGMFVFDHQRNAITIPYQNISIQWVSLSYFEIIDEDGTRYIFGNSESSRETTWMEFPNKNIRFVKKETIECVTTWHLASVESLKGDKVQFTYTSGPDIEYTNFNRDYELKAHTSGSPGSFSETIETKDGSVKIKSPKYISKITAPTKEITFGINTRPTGTSYIGFSNQYTYMEIRNINVPTSAAYTKRINLNFSTFRNGEPKLTGVDEVVNGIKQNLFSFAYYDETANFPNPHNFTTYIDFWGYWSNSASSSTLRPGISLFRTNNRYNTNFTYTTVDNLSDAYYSSTGYSTQTSDYILGESYYEWYPSYAGWVIESYDYDFASHTSADVNGGPYSISGSNRSPNLNCTKAYVLQKITYPTGGYVEYTYEQNEYQTKASQPRGTNTYKAGGLRIKSVKQNDGNSSSTVTYNYPRGIPLRDVRDEYFYTAVYYTGSSYNCICEDEKTHAHWHIDASSNAVLSPTDISGSHVMYPTVEEIHPDGSKIIHEFSTPIADGMGHGCDDKHTYAVLQTRYKIGGSASDNSGYARVKGRIWGHGYQWEKLNTRHWLRGLPVRETQYDPSGNFTAQTDYSYRVGKSKGKVLAFKPSNVYFSPVVFVFQYVSQPIVPNGTVTSHKYNPKSETLFTYTSTDYRPKEITTKVQGNGIYYGQNEVTTQKIKYSNEYINPTEYDGEVGGIKSLQERKAVVPIEVMTIRNDSVVAAEIMSFKSFVRSDKRIAVPYAKYTFATDVGIPKNSFANSTISYYGTGLTKDVRYEEVSRIDNYDTNANPCYATSPFSNDKVYMYGYNGTLPIAEVEIPRDIPAIPYQQQFYEFSLENLDAGNLNNGLQDWLPIMEERKDVHISFQFYNVQSVELTYQIINLYTYNWSDPETLIRFFNGVGLVELNLTLDEGEFIYFEHVCTPTYEYAPMSYDFNYKYLMSEQGENLTAPKIFHTSFENSGEGTALAKAKTGIQAKSGTYAINLNGFNPGDYILSYWKSTDSGASWEKITENMTVTQGMTSKTIGGSYYIDEVRLIPKGALIKTYTYRPDAGKTSETDHNGNTRYWEYDDRGRVVRALDNDRRILETYEYNIKN